MSINTSGKKKLNPLIGVRIVVQLGASKMRIEQQILDKLLHKEFRELKKRFGEIKLEWDFCRGVVIHDLLNNKNWFLVPFVGYAWLKDVFPLCPPIFLNLRFKHWFYYYPITLKHAIQHECLHLLINKGDGDEDFKNEAISRNIPSTLSELFQYEVSGQIKRRPK